MVLGFLAFIAITFLVAFVLVRKKRGITGKIGDWGLLIPTVAWGLAALWELGVCIFSPEANIRVDLLGIVFLAILLSIVGIVLVARN